MSEPEIRKLIREALKEELASIFMAKTIANKNSNRTSVRRFETEGPLENIRNIQPFGVSSRAPKDTPVLILPINYDPTHPVSAGHFDEDKPQVNQDGETILYNAYGRVIYLSQDSIQIGSDSADEPLVLGNVFKNNYAKPLLAADKAQTHVSGPPGFLTSVPVNIAAYVAVETSPINDDAILSDTNFTEK